MITVPVTQKAMVIGGGVSGMSAALHAAAVGKDVLLVEKDAQLGGFANKLHKVFPKDFEISAYREPDVPGMIAKVEADELFNVALGAVSCGGGEDSPMPK